MLKAFVDKFPRCGIAHLPTPFEKMSNLSERLGVNLFIKRDDQTGLAFGGNKARKLDSIMADVLAKKCDSIITWAGVQSNWCRQTAAAASRVGVKPILILFQRPNLPADCDGNLYINHFFNVEMTVVETENDKSFMKLDDVNEAVEAAADRERKKGRNPYIAPIGGSLTEGSMTTPLGAISYAGAFLEILDQAAEQNIDPGYIVLTTGSAGTHAGLLAGAELLNPRTKVVGISVTGDSESVSKCVKTIAERTFESFGTADTLKNDAIVFDEYNGEGYGVLNEETVHAIRLVAETEGILLDPVYTGKAMTGLIDLIDKGYFKKGDNIVFLHSGGTPALFPYRGQILDFMKNIKKPLTNR